MRSSLPRFCVTATASEIVAADAFDLNVEAPVAFTVGLLHDIGKLVMSQARQVILLADSGKAGKVAFARAGRLENIHVLVTDKQLDKHFAKELIKKGIKVIKA